MLNRTRARTGGFSLIELLLVLAIIGIVAAIAIPALLGQRKRAKAKAVQANVNNIAGECARINDSMKEAGTVLTPTAIVTSVLSLPNYSLPNARNPYYDNQPAYADVFVVGGTVVAQGHLHYPDVTGSTFPAVTIIGYYYWDDTLLSMKKVVALD